MKCYKQLDILKNYKKVAIICHLEPDADALCSAVVLKTFLKKQFNLSVDLFADYATLPPNNFPLIKGEVFNKKPQKYGAAIMVDTPNMARLGKFKEIYYDASFKIVIDHHATNDFSGNINIVEDVSSTCEIVYSILKCYKYPLNKEICNEIYAGIIADTNNFAVGKMNKRTFATIAEIFEFLNQNYIYELIFSNNSLKNMQVLAKSIENIEIFEGGKIIFSQIDEKTAKKLNILPQDYDGVINRLATIAGNVFVCFVHPKNGRNYVSMRAKLDYDVGTIAKANGGGGHLGAAAFETEQKYEDIKNNLLEQFKQQLKNKNPIT